MMYARENYKTSPSLSEFIALCDAYLDHLLFTNWKLSSFWMSYIEIAETVEFAESTKRGRLGAASISKKTNGSLVFRIWWSELFSLLVYRSLCVSPWRRSPEAWEYLTSRGFSVQLGKWNPFGKIPIDQACKETVNKDTQSVGAPRDSTLKQSTSTIWLPNTAVSYWKR